MATLSHAITTTAVSSGEEHARIVLNLGEHHPAIVMTSSGSSSGIPPSTVTDSGYASMIDGSPRSFCKGSIEGIAIPGSKLWSQKVKLKVFSKPLSEAAENRFEDLMEFIPKGLEDYISRARLAVKPYSIILKVLGEDEATAKPWIFIQCDKALTRKIKKFFKQDHIKSEYHPTSNDELQPPFRVFLCERPPRKIAATDTVDVYAQSHFGLASSSAPCCIKVTHPSGRSRIGTLGGLIKIIAGDGSFNLFGMTAGHIFASDDFLDDESELYESMDEDTDEDENSSTDDEEVVDLDLGSLDDGESISSQYEKIETGTELEDDDMPTLSWTKMGRLQDMSVNTINNGMNLDWALITIDDLLLYRGIAGTDPIHKMQENAELKEPLELPNQRRSSQAVTLCGGTSGTKEGILSASWSYLQLSPGKALVRTYTLTLSDHTELLDGDCGAWVVDKTTHELYGHVVASGVFGEAYVVPLDCSFENIRLQLGAKSVCLPQPQEVILWLQRVIETRERIRERSPSPVRMVRERIVERERERTPSPPQLDRIRVRKIERQETKEEVHDFADSFYILPPRPNSSAGTGLSIKADSDGSNTPPSPNSMDAFTIGPVTALKLLCAGIEALVKVTGDIPPIPRPTFTTPPNMRGMQAEKESISNFYKNLPNFAELHKRPRTPPSSSRGSEDIDRVSFRKQPLSSPEIAPTEPYIIIGDNAEPLNVQHSVITRKFYSKHPPPISLEDYLMRIHKFCPMSTAVYLATSYYIHKLAVDERAIPVTRRNCHRLLLAGLRVAMKALEDLSYPHSRFAKVGGVSENELARLEISFCFLTNFEFKTSKEKLLEHAISLKQLSQMQGAVGFVMPLKSKRRGNGVGVGVGETVQEVIADA